VKARLMPRRRRAGLIRSLICEEDILFSFGVDSVEGFLNEYRKPATIVTTAETDHPFSMARRPLEYSSGCQSERRPEHLHPAGDVDGAEREAALPPARVA
jgi:hypothetical protein